MTTPRQRDRGLRRISSLTRWVASGAVCASGLFAVLLVRPAHHTTTVATNGNSGQGGSTQLAPSAGAPQDNGYGYGDDGSGAPAAGDPYAGAQNYAPTPTTQPAQVQSGGS